MISKAPPESQEYVWGSKELSSLNAALDVYTAHRKTGDPNRTSSHQGLYRTFNEVIKRVVTSLNACQKEKSPKFPCVEADVEASFRRVVERDAWHYICRGCGHDARNKKDFWISNGLVYCGNCKEQYTLKCYYCEERSVREQVKIQGMIFDTNDRKPYCVCKGCNKKPSGIKTETCKDCHGRILNGSSGNPAADVTAEEITALSGGPVCYACAAAYRRGDCGHISTRLHEINVIQNVEDDDRDREDIGRGFSRVCATCRDAQGEDRDAVQHWEAAKKTCTSRTYDDLKSKRSFGVEIEVVQPKKMKPMSDDMKAFWTSKRDASLPEVGVELASTVLYGDAGLGVVKDLCDYAKKHSWSVDARAGLHLHIGLPDTPTAQLAAVAMGYHLTYDLWSSFVAPSRQRCKYCRKNSYDPKKLLISTPTDLIHLILTDPAVEGRRCWVNWHSYSQHGTVEIRMHHGTLMYDKIANWVKAHSRFVDWCIEKKTHEAVYEILSGKTVRQQFLLITQDAWKDRPLGRYFRQRAKELFDGCAPLPESNCKLRRRGIKPSAYKPGFDFRIGKSPAYICRKGDRHYIISDHPSGGRGSSHIARIGWSDRLDPVRFHTRVDGMNFIKEAAAEGIDKALTTLNSKPKRKEPATGWTATLGVNDMARVIVGPAFTVTTRRGVPATPRPARPGREDF